MKKTILVLIFIIKNILAFGQLGCTDIQAFNHDPMATENDGSCMYATTNYNLTEITVLPDFLQEISGIAYVNDGLWGQLDGGNDDEIYKIDTITGAVLHTTIIANAENVDWEDLAEDDTHLYICDCGNNVGNRTDLRIYKVQKSDLEMNVVFPEIIDFTLSDQTDFTAGSNDHNFDIEALLVKGDSLHIFSKNWQNFMTRHYVLPKSSGTYEAQLRDSLNVQGQVTSADISDDGEIVLMGYNVATSEAFFWLLFDYPEGHVFRGNKRKISLGSALNISQIEAITFREGGAGYIAAEKFSVLPPKLHKFNISQWTDSLINSINYLEIEPEIFVFPNPTEDILTVQIQNLTTDILEINIMDSWGRIIGSFPKEDFQVSQKFQLDTSKIGLKTGIYFLQFQTESKQFVKIITLI